jgi:4,5-DOPA dioxygenase extradiol
MGLFGTNHVVTIGRKFLQYHNALKMSSLSQIPDTFGNTVAMPDLFLGHGSPMNAIEENEFVAGFMKIGEEIPTPLAILCVSAHWETRGGLDHGAWSVVKHLYPLATIPVIQLSFDYTQPPQYHYDLSLIIG